MDHKGWILLMETIIWMFQGPRTVVACPPQCICDDTSLRSECNRVDLEVVPFTLNPMIEHLSITGNKIKQIRYQFDIYKKLMTIDMTNNYVKHLHPNTFDNQLQLTSLNLSRNLIEVIEPGSFQGLTSLLILKLDGNKISNIPAKSFESLSQLEIVDLSDNIIKSLQSYAFEELISLRALSLSNNELESMPSESFRSLKNLWKLDMCCNPIKELKRDSIRDLVELRFLYLDSCSIDKIQVGSFSGPAFLSELHLHDNTMPNLPIEAFFNLTRLIELTIGHIRDVRSIESGTFGALKSLKRIRIINAKSLRILNLNAFDKNERLESITFIDNRNLQTLIPFRQSVSLKNLQEVNMRGNALQTLDENSFPMKNLKLLDLRDNSFVCNCSLRWLHNWLKSRIQNDTSSTRPWFEKRTIVYPITCSLSPRHVVNLLSDMSDEDFKCETSSNPQMLMLAILASVMCLIVILFVFVIIRYRRVLKSKFGSQQKESYIEPRRPFINDTVSVMYDTCRSSPRRSHMPPTHV